MRIPLNKSTIGEEEKNAVRAVLESDRLTMGDRCRAFEQEFADFIGVEHAVMVNSGSSANLIALFAMANSLLPRCRRAAARIPAGSEVIVPALTWSTTVWPVLQVGAKPVFVDCDPRTLQMTPQAVEAAVTPDTSAIVDRPRPRAARSISRNEAIARRRKLWLFEDTCESLGVDWNGRKVGSFGQLASFSFYFSHHITTIEGGMVTTGDGRLADLLRALRSHGWVRDMRARAEIAADHPHIDPRFLFLTTGFNVRADRDQRGHRARATEEAPGLQRQPARDRRACSMRAWRRSIRPASSPSSATIRACARRRSDTACCAGRAPRGTGCATTWRRPVSRPGR